MVAQRPLQSVNELPTTSPMHKVTPIQPGGRLRRFITSLPDHRTHPAHELADLYRQRWEIELGFRENKQSLQEGEQVLRSKQPVLVRRSCEAC